MIKMNKQMSNNNNLPHSYEEQQKKGFLDEMFICSMLNFINIDILWQKYN